MKKIFGIFTASIITVLSFAQAPTSQIVLNKNQELLFTNTINGTMNQEMMGQQIDIKADVISNRKITVTNISTQQYNVDAVNMHIKMNMNIMGQDKNFDSDNKDDMAGEMKEAGKNINVIKPQSLSLAGKCASLQKDSTNNTSTDPSSLLMANLMGGGSDEVATESYFMLIPQGKKVGDSWADSIINTSSKTYWNYTWQSDSANIAIIKATAKSNVTTTTNTQGMDIKINLTSDIKEDRKVDINTGIVIYKINTTAISGTLEVMGQSVPISGNMVTVTNKTNQ